MLPLDAVVDAADRSIRDPRGSYWIATSPDGDHKVDAIDYCRDDLRMCWWGGKISVGGYPGVWATTAESWSR